MRTNFAVLPSICGISSHYKATDNKGNLYEDMKPLASTGAVPRNVLLDRSGHIIAVDIYGEQLIKKLEELTKEGVQ